MNSQTDHLTKTRIVSALDQRSTRVAVLIIESIHLGVDLIDEQRPPIVEALVEHMEKQYREDPGTPRQALRRCLFEYAKEALRKSKTRERQLYNGITGEPDEPDEDSEG